MKIVFNNYKPFQGKHSVDIKPFNVFIGRNNAGKSSLSEIICYSTNIQSLGISTPNIFRIDDTTSKDSLINHSMNKVDDDMTNVGNQVNSILDLEEKTAEIKFRMNEIKHHMDNRDGSKRKLKITNKEVDVITEKIKKGRKKLDSLYEDLFSNKSIPMWFLRNHIDADTSTRIESRSDTKRKGSRLDLYIARHLQESKLNRASEYLHPHFQSGLGLEFDLLFKPFMSRPGFPYRSRNQEIKAFRNIINLSLAKTIYNENSHLDGKWDSIVDKKGRRPSFEKSVYYKYFTKSSNNFVETINDYLLHTFLGKNLLDGFEQDPLTIHNVKCKLNVTDNDLDITYSSRESEIIDKAHISYSKHEAHIYGKMPAKFSYIYNSAIYNDNIKFVSELLEKAAKDFTDDSIVPINRLDGILHSNNCYHYETTMPGLGSSGVFPKPNFDQTRLLLDRHQLATLYCKTIDNLPIKVKNAMTPASLSRSTPASFIHINFVNDKIIDKKHQLIYKKNGPQKIIVDEETNKRVNEIKRIGKFQNDVSVIAECMQNPKFKDVVFPYFKLDIKTNKVFGNYIKQKNLYTEFIDDPSGAQQISPIRTTTGLYQCLLAKSMEINELNTLYVKHRNKTKKLRADMTKKDKKTLEDIERFLIGGYLASASSKILELINAHIFYKNFHRNLADERSIQRSDTYGRLNDTPRKATIIDPVVFPREKGVQVYNKKALEMLFGENIGTILEKQVNKVRLNTAVNAHLSNLKIGYKFELGTMTYNKHEKNLPSSFDDQRFTDAHYLTVTKTDKESGKDLSPAIDFNEVGRGTRNLIAIFVQLELIRRLRGRRNHLLVIREPENHLHPNLTGRFLRYLVGKTVGTSIDIIIETHSEIILRQLQVLVKNSKRFYEENEEDNFDNIPISRKNLAIYYIDQNNEDESRIEEIEIDEDGFFEKELPDNFFAQNAKLIQGMWD